MSGRKGLVKQTKSTRKLGKSRARGNGAEKAISTRSKSRERMPEIETVEPGTSHRNDHLPKRRNLSNRERKQTMSVEEQDFVDINAEEGAEAQFAEDGMNLQMTVTGAENNANQGENDGKDEGEISDEDEEETEVFLAGTNNNATVRSVHGNQPLVTAASGLGAAPEKSRSSVTVDEMFDKLGDDDKFLEKFAVYLEKRNKVKDQINAGKK